MSAIIDRPRFPRMRAILPLAILIVTIFAAKRARATVTFVGGDGANWSGPVWTGGVFQFPFPGEDAALGAFSPARSGSITVNFDLVYSAALNSLTINASGLTTGTMTVSQTTAGTVMSASSEVIGSNAANNVYTQSAGTNNAGSLTLGQVSGGVGVYNLIGNGILTATSETLGNLGSGVGSISQSGGTNTIAVSGGFGRLRLGVGTSGTNSYVLSGGTLTTDFVTVGEVTGGSILQSGGTLTINTGLDVAVGNGSGGSYNLNVGGALTAPSEVIADHGNGGMTQGNGTTNTVSGNLTVGLSPGSTGSYQLIGGNLATGNETIGNGFGAGGIGNFTQSAGTHTIATALNVGNSANGQGTYGLQAGNLTVGGAATGTVTIGGSGATGGSGNFNQSGGNFTISGAGSSITVGGGPGTGAYSLSGNGGLNALNETIGGNGIFTQSGGANTISSSLSLNSSSAGIASYQLNGTGSLVVANVQIVRNATFSQDIGSTNTISNLLGIGGVNGATGTYLQTGGTLTVFSEILGTTTGDSGVVNHTGGSNTITNLLALGNYAATSAGTYNLGGTGTLNVTAASAQLIVGNGGVGMLNQTGGILNARNVSGAFVTNTGGTYHESAGTENGYFLNSGTFIYDGGAFNGKLENDGTVTLTASLTTGGGVLNNATISISVGSGLGASAGATLDNESTLNLTGGSLTGAGPILSNATLSGYGTIGGAGGFTNNGLIAVSGGQLAIANSGANANNGNFEIASGRQLQLTGSGLTNTGTLSLSTSTITGPATLTNAAGGSITGSGLIVAPLINAAGGVISNGGPGTLAITQAFTSAGLIQLAAFNATLSGGAITNTGSIQGLGIVGNSVINTGTVEAIGGTLSLSGYFQNQAGGLIRVGLGNKVLVSAGLGGIGTPLSIVNNAGIINLTGGTFDNNSHPLINGGQISGYGTFATGGTGLDNNGSITFSGGLTTVNGPVTNENGMTIVVAYNPAIFTGLVTNNGGGTFNIISTTAIFASGSSGAFSGTFTNNASSAFAVGGSGVLEVDGAPTLGAASSMAVGGTSTLRFKPTSGAASVGAGVTATVASGATLELAGSVSSLSSGANRVNITNSSSSPGILVSGTNQQVGNIDGAGTTQVNAGSDLTANHIIQNALVIGGAVGSPATVTIDASDTSGNPLGQSSELTLAGSLAPRDPIGAGGISSANLSSSDNTDLAAQSAGNPAVGGNLSVVPEPSTLLMSLLAVLGVISTQFVRHHLRSQTV